METFDYNFFLPYLDKGQVSSPLSVVKNITKKVIEQFIGKVFADIASFSSLQITL